MVTGMTTYQSAYILSRKIFIFFQKMFFAVEVNIPSALCASGTSTSTEAIMPIRRHSIA